MKWSMMRFSIPALHTAWTLLKNFPVWKNASLEV